MATNVQTKVLAEENLTLRSDYQFLGSFVNIGILIVGVRLFVYAL